MFSHIVTLPARALMLGLRSAVLQVSRPLICLQGISAEVGMQIAKDGSRWHQMAPDVSRMLGRQYAPLTIAFLFFVQWEVSDSRNVVSAPDCPRSRYKCIYSYITRVPGAGALGV